MDMSTLLLVLIAVAITWFVATRVSEKKHPQEPPQRFTTNETEELELYPCRANVEIDYQDANGDATRRLVNITAYGDGEQHSYFRGYCNLRREPRTFRIDRVDQAVDAETGEIIDDLYLYLEEREEP